MPESRTPEVVYQWEVSSGVDSPLWPGSYTIRIVEGGTYRNLASRRKYTVCEIEPDGSRIVYEYVRDGGEPVTRQGAPIDLAVVKAVGDTPTAILESPDGGSL